MAAKLSYQARCGFQSEPGLLEKVRVNLVLMLLNVGINAECQGSRARDAGKGQDEAMILGRCRITDIMLNGDLAFFGNPDPYPPQKQPASASAVISLFRSVFDRD